MNKNIRSKYKNLDSGILRGNQKWLTTSHNENKHIQLLL